MIESNFFGEKLSNKGSVFTFPYIQKVVNSESLSIFDHLERNDSNDCTAPNGLLLAKFVFWKKNITVFYAP